MTSAREIIKQERLVELSPLCAAHSPHALLVLFIPPGRRHRQRGDRTRATLLRCTEPAIGPKRTWASAPHMSAFGVKRTYGFALQMSAYDPERTLLACSFQTSQAGVRLMYSRPGSI